MEGGASFDKLIAFFEKFIAEQYKTWNCQKKNPKLKSAVASIIRVQISCYWLQSLKDLSYMYSLFFTFTGQSRLTIQWQNLS